MEIEKNKAVRDRLLLEGWELEGSWVNQEGEKHDTFRKGDTILKVEIQVFGTLPKKPKFKFKDFDCAILYSGVDFFVLPGAYVRTIEFLHKSFLLFRNRFDLIGMKGKKLLGELMDLGLKGSDFLNTTEYFYDLQDNRRVLIT